MRTNDIRVGDIVFCATHRNVLAKVTYVGALEAKRLVAVETIERMEMDGYTLLERSTFCAHVDTLTLEIDVLEANESTLAAHSYTPEMPWEA
jgi:hypothetical protein